MIFHQIEYGTAAYRQECDLRHRVLRVPLGLNLYDEDLSGESWQLHFGGYIDGTLVACVIGVPLSATVARIRQMAVSPERQRQGLGREIVQRVEQHLVGLGFREFMLHARLASAGFYEKLGYRRVGPEFAEVGIPHVKMERRLIVPEVATTA